MNENLNKIKSRKINIIRDNRGFFFEIYNTNSFPKLTNPFVQNNISYSKKNVIRGLHYQKKYKQSQLVTVLKGTINYVVADIMPNSTLFKKYKIFKLSHTKKNQIFVPGGFANGFEVISEDVLIHYNVDRNYNKSDDFGILFKDETLNIKWTIKKPIMSKKDKKLPLLKNIKMKNLPVF